MGLTELSLQVVVGRTLPGRIAARLHELIVDGTYPSGSRLPSPAELATEFGVTTAVIGEAVALLVSAGLVGDRAGNAVVVGRTETRAPGLLARVHGPVGREGLVEAIEAREVIERAIVRLAALRRTEADLERLRASLAGMRECREDPAAFSEFDFALHVALSDAARNQLLAGTLSTLHELVREMIALFTSTAVMEQRMDALIDSHARLVDAVERQDADEASHIIADMMALLRIEADRRLELALDD
jgi:GntR family transcriptional repressor for pyruvate dehydrogenase complex